jgi:hypothetical protein
MDEQELVLAEERERVPAEHLDVELQPDGPALRFRTSACGFRKFAPSTTALRKPTSPDSSLPSLAADPAHLRAVGHLENVPDAAGLPLQGVHGVLSQAGLHPLGAR